MRPAHSDLFKYFLLEGHLPVFKNFINITVYIFIVPATSFKPWLRSAGFQNLSLCVLTEGRGHLLLTTGED